MVRLNSYGYVGSVLSCDSCGRDIIIANREKWRIVNCSRKGHTVIERNSTKSYLITTFHTKGELKFVNEASIEKGFTFEDVIRGS